MPASKASNAVAIFIGSVFCLLGLGIAVWGLAASPMDEDSWILLAFGLVFGGFGCLPLYFVSRERKQQAKRDDILSLHPGQPWMLREDWAQGRAKSGTRSGLAFAWIFAIFWNAVSAPILFLFSDMVEEAGPVAYIALLFPLVGLGLLYWAVRMTIHWRTFGKTWFEMTTVPGALGRTLEGKIWTRFARPPDQGVILKLTCFNRYVTGTGKNRSTHEKILWREEQTVPFGAVLSTPGASAIPVRIPLPADAPETNTENSSDSIHWVLAAEASVPGVDYSDEFEVPVFRTPQSPGPDDTTSEPAAVATTPVSLREIEKAGIRVGPSPAGGTEFYFSAARNPGAAAVTTVFFSIWSAIVWFLFHSDAPVIFPVIFGLFEVLLFVAVLQLWFGTATVTVGSGALTSRRRTLGIGFSREIPFEEIAGLRMKIGMQSGGRHGTPHYDIQLVLKSGKEHTLAGGISRKRRAEWIVERMCSVGGFKRLH